jgi:transcriptional regulator with XRE-family HTH domain
MNTGPSRTKLQRQADEAAEAARGAIGRELRAMRHDAGLTLRAVAEAAGVDDGFLHRVELGERDASQEAIWRIAFALGGRPSLKVFPTTGPRVRDRWQAPMIEALLAIVRPRLARLLEVPIQRPVRGFIDVVIGDPDQDLLIAAEFESGLRRLELQIRRSQDKAAGLLESDAADLARSDPDRRPSVSRLLIVRNTVATREIARTFERMLTAAFPARTADAYRALVDGDRPWPGPAIMWATVDGKGARILDRPPRGVRLGR